MSCEASEILARALENDAYAQERGELEDIGMQYDEVLGQILPIDENPEQVTNMAFCFWDDWLDAKNHDWQFHEPMQESDWPRVARIIANSVRESSIPLDPVIRKLFVPIDRPPIPTAWQRIKAWLNRRA